MDESGRRDDASDDTAATEGEKRIQQATTGRMMPIDVGAGPGGTIVTESAQVREEKARAQESEISGPVDFSGARGEV